MPVEGVSIFSLLRSRLLASAIFTFVWQKVFLQTQPRWWRLHSVMRVPVHMAAISGTGRCTTGIILGLSTPREKEERLGASRSASPAPGKASCPQAGSGHDPGSPGGHSALVLHPLL